MFMARKWVECGLFIMVPILMVGGGRFIYRPMPISFRTWPTKILKDYYCENISDLDPGSISPSIKYNSLHL